MTNDIATQNVAQTPSTLRTPDAATIANCGGCVQCATYYFGGGHNDHEILQHRAEHLRAVVNGLKGIWGTSNTDRFLRATRKAMRINQSHCTTRNTFALALALLTLSLTACGTEETAATPAPELVPQELSVSPLVADGPPSVRGGTLANRVFHNAHSYESCMNPDPPHCVTFQASLPMVPSGMELRVAPIVPIVSMTGQPVSFTPDGAPPCVEPLLAELTYSTDAWIWPRSLPGTQVAMEKGATKLTVNLCFRGEVRAQLGDLSGTVSYARPQPLHR